MASRSCDPAVTSLAAMASRRSQSRRTSPVCHWYVLTTRAVHTRRRPAPSVVLRIQHGRPLLHSHSRCYLAAGDIVFAPRLVEENPSSPPRELDRIERRIVATTFGAQLRIALMATCLADAMFPQAAIATVQLLERLGHEVVFPTEQTCCGQMHINTGYLAEAAPLIRRHVELFERADADVVVAPSGSCVGSVRHQHGWVARRSGLGHLAQRVDALAARTFELSELLIDVLGVHDVGAYYPHHVVYHPTCHSMRMLCVGDKPLQLLRHVRGLTLLDLPDADTCCGFGGTFAIKNADTSTAMLADKMACVIESGAQICTAGDSSCLMHIGGGLSRIRSGVRTVHLAEILASIQPSRPKEVHAR